MYKNIQHNYKIFLHNFQNNSTPKHNTLIIKSLNLKLWTKKIGQIIEERVRLQNMDVTEFAKKIGVERSNAYNIFKRESIDTNLLKKIGQILNYDFFQDLLEEKTKQEIALKSKIDATTFYVPVKFSDEEIEKYGIKDKILMSLNDIEIMNK